MSDKMKKQDANTEINDADLAEVAGGDGVADIITSAGPGGGPHVKVLDGRTGAGAVPERDVEEKDRAAATTNVEFTITVTDTTA